MGFIRIILKSCKIAYRSKRRFLSFILMYATLIVMTSYIFNFVLFAFFKKLLDPLLLVGFTGLAWLLLFVTLVLSIIYSLVISAYRKKEVATLRTIGWDMGSIRTLFMSELIFVFIVAFILVVEIMVHFLGVTQYLNAYLPGEIIGIEFVAIFPPILVGVFFLVLVLQIIAIYLGYLRMLKVRPMEAMRKA